MSKYKYAAGDNPIDDYTIQYALGRGGFGEVYFANSKVGREVALKAILDHEEIELRGVQNCMNLKSSRLLTIYDVGRDTDGVLWIVMEYIRGPSLQDVIAEYPGGLQPEQAVYLLRELAIGLSDLHNAGIVHRDLKPSNVFFDGGRLKIGDYSLSKTIASHQQSQHTITVGTVHYMAPEISLGRYDKTVDIYALGVIFYELLTGQPPHTGDTVGEVLMKHLHSDVNTELIDEPYHDLVLRSMNRDPSARYQTAEEFAKAALQSVGTTSLVDSFHPNTLSQIGQRASDRKQQLQTTGHLGTSPNSNSDEASDPNLDPSNTNDAGHPLELRLLLAAVAVVLAMALQIFASNRGGLSAWDGILFGIATFCAALIPAYRLLRWPPRHEKTSWRDSAIWLATASGSVTLLFLLSVLMTPIEFEGIAVTSCGCLLSLMLIDWRRATSFNRPSTLQWYPTIAPVVIAAVVCVGLRMQQWWSFSSATAMGLSLALQAMAPRALVLKKTLPSLPTLVRTVATSTQTLT